MSDAGGRRTEATSPVRQASPVSLLVKAVVGESGDVDAFDDWYQTHHMPIGGALLRAPSVRFWSIDKPRVHYALYGFSSLDFMLQRLGSVEFEAFSTDFDQTCPTEATRVRETLRLAQSLPAVSPEAIRTPERSLAGAFIGELPQAGAGVLLERVKLSGSDDSGAFDNWYETRQMPMSVDCFGAKAARFWSVEDPTVHHALYEFASVERMEERLGSPDHDQLVDDLDGTCPIDVARIQERLRAVQSLPKPTEF